MAVKHYKKKQTSSYTTGNPSVRLVSGSTQKVYAEFTLEKKKSSKVKEFSVVWYYKIGGKIFTTSESTMSKTPYSQYSGGKYYYRSQYDVPDDATSVRCAVKTVGAQYTYGSKKTKASYKGGTKYSTWFSVHVNKTKVPSSPSVELDNNDKRILWMECVDIESINTSIRFQIVQEDGKVIGTRTVEKRTNIARTSFKLNPGHTYKVRCAAYSKSNNAWSAWSDYSSDINTVPAAPGTVKAMVSGENGTTVTVSWDSSPTATSYEIAYTTDPAYFGQSDQVSTVSTSDASTTYVFANSSTIDLGKTWYFKVRAKNDKGESEYTSNYATVMMGKKPSAPTTWSSVTKMYVGEKPVLYWVHNSTDGSSQTKAEIKLTANNRTTTITWVNNRTGDEKDATVEYPLDLSKLTTFTIQNGVKLKWKVRTKGVMTSDEYWSDWSEEREIDIYEKPTLALSLTSGSSSSANIDTLTSFPVYLNCNAGPSEQTPVSYYISIVSNQGYDAMNEMGVSTVINAGDTVYSNIFDSDNHNLQVPFTATDVILIDGNEYTIRCTVAMDSGLTATNELTFQTVFQYSDLQPEAIFSDIDTDNVSIAICPFCSDMSKVSNNVEDIDSVEIPLAENVEMSVYRINHDGTFTEILSNIPNSRCTWCIDPHPPLDIAYYRIVAISTKTGNMEFVDVESDPIGEALAPDPVPIIIQWDETWSSETYQSESMNFIEDEELSERWNGSLIKLPYNIDVADNNNKDVNFVKYIGRSHPVSYYGTQLGVTATWKTVIPKTNTETLYKLRQLSIHMGDCYVREPSGSGYWADVSVSMDQSHDSLTIPITFTLTRVEGEK
nr:MAG TPA: Angiopoietin-1 receptor [Caudoviricetes sp.]